MVQVRRYCEADHAAVVAVGESLVGWFDEHARQVAIPTDIRHQHVFVAVDGTEVVGFISLYVSEGRVNIGWMGVVRSRQRQGIGTRLLRAAEDAARAMGISEIAVMTLGDSVEYPPYDQTRAFYRKSGLVPYQRSKTDNWGCPEELKMKKTL